MIMQIIKLSPTLIESVTIMGRMTSEHRWLYWKNRKRVLASESICAICGRPVDKSLKAPDPMSATVDHIIPVAKQGHPSDINNLQLAHRICNRMKSDKILSAPVQPNKKIKLSRDWRNF